MSLKSVMAATLAAVVLVGATVSVRAEEKDLKEKLAAVEKELMPIKTKAATDPEVKAAQEAVKSAQETVKTAQAKLQQATEAAMIKVDPKAKDLLEQRTKLQAEAAAVRRAEMGAAKKAPAEKKE